MSCKCSNSVKLSISACFGILLALIGGVLFVVFPDIIENKIAQKAVIKESNTKVYEAWESSPVDVDFKIYFFNLTNPNDFKNNRSKPYFEELGPYVFKQIREKVDIEFTDDEVYVSYRNNKTYVWDPESSNGDIDDIITTVNLPIQALVQKLKFMPGVLKLVLNRLLVHYNEDVYMSKSVKELAFDGYKEELIAYIQDTFGINFLKDAIFGVFHEAKISDDGLFEINTGEDDIKLVGEMEKWNNSPNLTYWGEPQCNMLNGTDGSMFHPSVSKEETLYVFSTDLCRSLHLTFEKDTKHYGINTFRFHTPENLFADPNTYAPNKCYCTQKPCFKKGLLDVSKCRKGAPIVMSSPHFYQADSEYQDAVENLHPNRDKHETFLDIEPNTGIVLQAAKRVQINSIVIPVAGYPNFENVDNIIFPVLWVEEGAVVDEETAEKLKNAILTPIKIVTGTSIGLMVFGGLLLILSVIIVIWISKTKNSGSSNFNTEGEDNYAMKHVPS